MNITAQSFRTKTRTWLFIAALTALLTHPPIAERVRRLRALDGNQILRLAA